MESFRLCLTVAYDSTQVVGRCALQIPIMGSPDPRTLTRVPSPAVKGKSISGKKRIQQERLVVCVVIYIYICNQVYVAIVRRIDVFFIA